MIGTAYDVWELIQAVRDLGSSERVVEEGALTKAQVAVAEAYYRAHKQEIDACISENRRSLAEVAQLYPTFEVHGQTTRRRR